MTMTTVKNYRFLTATLISGFVSAFLIQALIAINISFSTLLLSLDSIIIQSVVGGLITTFVLMALCPSQFSKTKEAKTN